MPTLNWIGKEAVVKHHSAVSFRFLEPVAELFGRRRSFVIVKDKQRQEIEAQLSEMAT